MEPCPVPGVFAFETFMERTLEYTPMRVRMKLALLQRDPRAWGAQGSMPSELVSAIDELGLPVPGRAAWSGLSDLQRFALIELAREGRARKLRAALEEFGLRASRGRFAAPEDAAAGQEAQVFALLARSLGEGPHRAFAREIDRGTAG
ncbi:MAG: hypothetical protein JWQ76_2603 [Ramlibacter sp.]|nr:hypothetical protein [Ramlibacter sp.]